MSLLPVSAIPVEGGYNINNSLRFRSNSGGGGGTWLNRTPASASNRQTWTWSGWVKRGLLSGAVQTFFGAATGGQGDTIYFNTQETLAYYSDTFGGVKRETTQLFRDTSAWYHIVVTLDTTNATATQRCRMWVNGSEVTTWNTSTLITLNAQGNINNNVAHNIARNPNNNAQYSDLYLAELNFIDGQALTASSFGETNTTTGVWQPKAYTGTYGTNGFYQKYFDPSVFPVLVNTTVTSQSNTAQATITVNVPSGVNNGDLLILVLSGGNSTVYTTPAGWTLWFTTTNTTAIFYRTASSEPASYTVTGSTNTTAIGFMLAYRNAAIDVMGTLSATTASPIVAPAITTTASNTIVVAFMRNNAVSNVFSTPSGFTPLISESDTSDPSGAIFTKTQAAAGSSGTASSTPTITPGGAAGTSGRGIQFSIKPISNTNLGLDYSGNGNNWTTNDISVTAGATYDAMTDSPTNTSATIANYCVLNPINQLTTATLSNGNLAFTTATTGHNAIGSIGMSSGKYYWEAETSAGTTQARATVYGTAASTYYSFAANNTVYGFRFDADAGTLDYTTNGTTFDEVATGLTSGPYFPYFNNNGTTSKTISVNFGQRPFTYTPPAGYSRLNTFNLPTSTIVKGNNFMDATLWAGNNASPRSFINAAGFRPDLVWIKNRSTADWHGLYDASRGVNNVLYSNQTSSQQINEPNGYISAFNANGFSVVSGSSTANNVNASGSNYVGWQWQAGSSAVTNTSGTISAQVRANTTTGFSIVTYTGNGAATATVGHGLGVAPKVVLVKGRSTAQNWGFYTNALDGSWDIFNLNTTANKADSTATAPTSSVFSLITAGSLNTNAATYVAYCWAEIAGFSRFASYTGNNSTNGPFIYLGFRPKFVMIKKTSGATLGGWTLIDTSRSPFNLVNDRLVANDGVATETTNLIDILSNGFKVRATSLHINENTVQYIYMAFAENPFKNALAR